MTEQVAAKAMLNTDDYTYLLNIHVIGDECCTIDTQYFNIMNTVCLQVHDRIPLRQFMIYTARRVPRILQDAMET